MSYSIQVFTIALLSMIGCIAIGMKIADLTICRKHAKRTRLRQRYAIYCGWQEGWKDHKGFHLWTLKDDRLGTRYSTVTEAWLDSAIEVHLSGIR